MIKTLTAFTQELDDCKLAVEEILGQLNLEQNLLKNSVGIITCYTDFIDTDIISTLSQKLPFRLAGATTSACATNGSEGEMTLALMILTSDDINFSVSLTEPVGTTGYEALKKAYHSALSSPEVKPGLILAFLPIASATGDSMINAISEITDGVPTFGTLTMDSDPNFANAKVICDGNCYANCAALILLEGAVNPKFYLGSISDDRQLKGKGIVTDFEGFHLKTINDILAVDYMVSLGLTRSEEGGLIRSEMFPLIVDFNDGTTPILRAILKVSPEGWLVLAGDAPVGTTISVGSVDLDEVIRTTEETLSRIEADGPHNGLIMYSCAARFFVAMEYGDQAELEAVSQKFSSIPYIFSFSGGEICPVPGPDNSQANRMHNYTFIACAF